MGCKSSKVAVVNEANEAWVNSVDPKCQKPTSAKPRSGKKSKKNVFLVEEYKDKNKTKRSDSDSSLDGEIEGQTRGVGSATSKISSRTYDSGLGEDYQHVITEGSEPTRQKLADGRPDTPDLLLTGTQIQGRKRSGKTRDTNDILEELQHQGLLLDRPKSRGGLAFDIMLSPEGSLSPIKRAPPRLAKLKKKSKKKKTKEQLEAKLRAAEERRKAKEQEMKERLHSQANKDKQIKDAMDAFAESQKKVAEQSTEKVDRAAENREARLRAFQEKAQKRKEHAERVRQLKLQRQAEQAQLDQEQSGENPNEQSKENTTDVEPKTKNGPILVSEAAAGVV
ncbi:uncharacterized protein LOC144445597 [Glandiceps talaboti]